MYTVKLGSDSQGNLTVLDKESGDWLATIGIDDDHITFNKSVGTEREQEIREYLKTVGVDAW